MLLPLPPGRTALSIAVGYRHTCVALDDASVVCLGNDSQGQLGNDSELQDSIVPVRALLSGPLFETDTTGPTVTCTTPAPTYQVGQPGTVSATVTDDGSGPAQTTVSAPAVTTSSGSFTASLTGFDLAGNSTTVGCPYTVTKVPTQVQTAKAIVITTSPLKVNINLNLTAVLTRSDTGAALVGQPVTFRIGGAAVCTATTNSAGKASCGGSIAAIRAVLAGGYTATFAGDATHAASSASGPIL